MKKILMIVLFTLSIFILTNATTNTPPTDYTLEWELAERQYVYEQHLKRIFDKEVSYIVRGI